MRREQGLIVAAILTAEVCSALESTMVLAALHSWIRIYKEPALVGWVVTSYLLVAGSTAAIAGRLGDIFGRRRVILCLLAACGTGSAISAFGNAIEWIIVGRAVQGLAGGILPLAYALLREHLPEDKVPLGVGMVVAAATLSGSLGLLLGGYLTDTFGPNSVFWASMAWAALSFTAIVAIVPRGRIGSHVGKVDFAGGLMLCPIIAVVLFGVSNGNQAGWDDTKRMAPAVRGVAVHRQEVSIGGVRVYGHVVVVAFDDLADDFRAHCQAQYAVQGRTYDDFEPAYRYGHALASDTRYDGRTWDEIEPQARAEWERRNPQSAWERFKSAARHAWERATRQ